MDEQKQEVAGRLRRSRAEVDQLVAEYEASGLSQAEFCRKHALSAWKLSGYLKRRREARAEEADVNLMAVDLRGAAAGRNKDSGLAVALAAGRRIEVSCGFDGRTLLELLGLLERF